METMVASASQYEEDSTEPVKVNMSQLYLQAVGGEKKRRVYGLGSQASAFYPETFSSSSTTSRYDFASDEHFTQRVNEVVGQRVRVEVQELQFKMNEDVRLYKEQLEQQFQQIKIWSSLNVCLTHSLNPMPSIQILPIQLLHPHNHLQVVIMFFRL